MDNVRSCRGLSNNVTTRVLIDKTIKSQDVREEANTPSVSVDIGCGSAPRSMSFSTATTRSPSKSPPPGHAPAQLVNDLSQQLLDIRTQRTALLGRENDLIDALKALGKDDEDVGWCRSLSHNIRDY
jgi:hypothetical protein